MSNLITMGLGKAHNLATIGYGTTEEFMDQPVFIVVPSIGMVGTGGRILLPDPPKEDPQGTEYRVVSVLQLVNMTPPEDDLHGEVEKFFVLMVVRVSSWLEDHEEQGIDVRVTAALYGMDINA